MQARTLIFGGWIVGSLWASCSPDLTMNPALSQKVTLVQGDTVYEFSLLAQASNVDVALLEHYTWYQGNALHTTQGAYSGKLLEGSFTVTLRDHTLLRQGAFHQGQRTGTWLHWYPNGNLRTVRRWKAGQPHGASEHYDSLGRVLEQTNYRKGTRHGDQRTYGYGQGTTQSLQEIHFEQGIPHGNFIEYDSAGHWIRKGKWLHGELHGRIDQALPVASATETRYYQEYTTFRKGEKTGPFVECYPTGQLKRTGAWHQGKLHGKITQYYGPVASETNNPVIQSEYAWRRGQKHGRFKEYDRAGNLVQQGVYRNDQRAIPEVPGDEAKSPEGAQDLSENLGSRSITPLTREEP